jgi:hypothetical protein
MNKHTPAPWHIGQGNGEGEIFAESGRMKLQNGGIALYSVCSMTSGYNDEEDAANVRLISAAPELLAALQSMVEAFGHYCEGDPSDDEVTALEAALKTINKATGVQS